MHGLACTGQRSWRPAQRPILRQLTGHCGRIGRCHAHRTAKEPSPRTRHPDQGPGLPRRRLGVGRDDQYGRRLVRRRVLQPRPRGRARSGPALDAGPAQAAAAARPDGHELPGLHAGPRRQAPRGPEARGRDVLRQVSAAGVPGAAVGALPAALGLDRQCPGAAGAARGRDALRGRASDPGHDARRRPAARHDGRSQWRFDSNAAAGRLRLALHAAGDDGALHDPEGACRGAAGAGAGRHRPGVPADERGAERQARARRAPTCSSTSRSSSWTSGESCCRRSSRWPTTSVAPARA